MLRFLFAATYSIKWQLFLFCGLNVQERNRIMCYNINRSNVHCFLKKLRQKTDASFGLNYLHLAFRMSPGRGLETRNLGDKFIFSFKLKRLSLI
jgi:hypothetical protein